MTALRLLRELVALPSVNPAFVPLGDPRAGEQRVAEFIAATAARAGLEVELQEVLPARPNVWAWLRARGRARQRVLLAPHLDTVGGDSDELWRPRVKHGRLYGRGACDTKGSAAAMLAAMIAVAESGRRPGDTDVAFVGLVDEESDQAGSRAVVRSGRGADLAVVGEPTRLAVVTAHKGDVWLELETRGRAAHGAQPELGRNAVHTMARVVDALQTRYAARIARRSHPLLGRPTINVGTIRGGTQPNIVPDRCVIQIDRRTLPGETEPGVVREIRAFLAAQGLRAGSSGLRSGPCPALETDWGQPLVRTLLDARGQAGPVGVHYFCDAAVLASGGIPSVVFGPGDIAQAHTPNEWVAVRQVEAGKGYLRRFLELLP